MKDDYRKQFPNELKAVRDAAANFIEAIDDFGLSAPRSLEGFRAVYGTMAWVCSSKHALNMTFLFRPDAPAYARPMPTDDLNTALATIDWLGQQHNYPGPEPHFTNEMRDRVMATIKIFDSILSSTAPRNSDEWTETQYVARLREFARSSPSAFTQEAFANACGKSPSAVSRAIKNSGVGGELGKAWKNAMRSHRFKVA